MDTRSVIAIAGATFLLALIRGGYSSYKEWKGRRAALPYNLRNAGVVTDGRLRAFEWTVLILFWFHVAWILLFTAYMVAIGNGYLTNIPIWIFLPDMWFQ